MKLKHLGVVVSEVQAARALPLKEDKWASLEEIFGCLRELEQILAANPA